MVYEIINGVVFHHNELKEEHVVLFEDKIVAIYDLNNQVDVDFYEKVKHRLSLEGKDLQTIDAKGQYVLPGFIDVHIHGYKGVDVMDGEQSSLHKMKQDLVENGVTNFLATTMTMDKASIVHALEAVKKVMKQQDNGVVKGAHILGVHLEGPFINVDYKGAQPKKHIVSPDHQLLKDYLDILKIVTIAPEIAGGLETIAEFKDNINFSIGHSGASYEQAMEAFECGACGTTHLFNAMTGVHHRNPGIVGAAFASDCYSELIADTIHVHPDLFPMITKAKGLNKLLLITDCMQGGGLQEGVYTLGGQIVTIKDGKCTLESGTIAGSVLKLNQALKNFVAGSKEILESIIPLVTINQAIYLNIEDSYGSIDIGKYADIVLMDQSYQINKTIVKGNVVYEN